MSERADPVRFFKDLYAVVVGVGLALAAEQIVDLHKSGIPIQWDHVPLFVAWIAVALPFAHVFVRYLDFAYGRTREGGGTGMAMGNILFGAIHYISIIALSLFLSRPLVFGYALVIFMVAVLVRDVSLRMHPRGWLSEVERRVSPIFLATAAGWLLVVVTAHLAMDGGSARDWVIRGGVLAVSLGFSFGIYLRAFDFFFAADPDEAHGTTG